jgi:hypothetical protein
MHTMTNKTMTASQRRLLVALIRADLKALMADDAAKAPGIVTVKRPARMIVTAPVTDWRVDVPMGPPACLITPDTAAGIARFSSIAFGA